MYKLQFSQCHGTQQQACSAPSHCPSESVCSPADVSRLLDCVCVPVHHQLTYLLDDPGVFANWRSMEGHSVNTFTLINAEGKEHYVKFIWTPKGGE